MKKQRKKRFKIWHGLLAVVLIGGIIVLSSPTIGTWVQGQFSFIDVEPDEVKLKNVDLTDIIEVDISLETRLKNEKEGEMEIQTIYYMHLDAKISSERVWIISAASNNRDCPYISIEIEEEAIQRLNNLEIATETLFQYFRDEDSEYNNNALGQLSDALSTFKLSHQEFVDLISPLGEDCLDNKFIMKAFPILIYEENVFMDEYALKWWRKNTPNKYADSTVVAFIEGYLDLLEEYVN